MSQTTDCVIVGAGLAGLATALCLSRCTPFRIKLIDQRAESDVEAMFQSARPLSLALASQRILQTCGAWTELQARAAPIKRVLVSQQGHCGEVDFTAASMAEPALGYVVPMGALLHALLQAVRASAQIDISWSSTVTALREENDQVICEWQSAEQSHVCHAHICMATDGAASPCRQYLGATTQHTGQAAVSFIHDVECQNPHSGIAQQRFMAEQGVYACLPLWQANQCRMVLTMSEERAKRYRRLSEARQLKMMQHAWRGRYTCEAQKCLGEYTVQPMVSQGLTAARIILLGDAQQTMYPLLAQGFNLACRDAAILAEQLADAVVTNKHTALSPAQISRFSQQRQRRHKQLRQWVQGIHDGFAMRAFPVAAMRAMGMGAITLLPGMKQRIARQLMGLAAPVPALARGILPEQESLLCHDN